MSEDLLDQLEFLCTKATQGKWWIDSHGVTMMAMDQLEVVFTTPCIPKTAVRHPETGNLSNWRNDWDASYIATACPKNIKVLIDELKRRREDSAMLDWLESNPYAITGQSGDIRENIKAAMVESASVAAKATEPTI